MRCTKERTKIWNAYSKEAAKRRHVCKAEANPIRIGCVCFAGTNIVLRFAYGSKAELS